MPAGANLVALFESVFVKPGASPLLFLNGEVVTAPHTSADLIDWRVGTQVNIVSPSNVVALHTSVLTTAQHCDAYVLANHNAFTAGGAGTFVGVYYRTGGGAFTLAPGSDVTLTDDLDVVRTFTSPGSHTQWALAVVKPAGTLTLNVGEMTLGLRLASANQLALAGDLDPYGFELVSDGGGRAAGSEIRRSPKYSRRRVRIDIGPPGLPVSFFTGASPNGNAMVSHLLSGLPMWLAWNVVEDPRLVQLARAMRVDMPVAGSELRRSLKLELELQERL